MCYPSAFISGFFRLCSDRASAAFSLLARNTLLKLSKSGGYSREVGWLFGALGGAIRGEAVGTILCLRRTRLLRALVSPHHWPLDVRITEGIELFLANGVEIDAEVFDDELLALRRIFAHVVIQYVVEVSIVV